MLTDVASGTPNFEASAAWYKLHGPVSSNGNQRNPTGERYIGDLISRDRKTRKELRYLASCINETLNNQSATHAAQGDNLQKSHNTQIHTPTNAMAYQTQRMNDLATQLTAAPAQGWED